MNAVSSLALRGGPALLMAISALAVAGCGLGAGEKEGGATVTVTRDFGTKTLGREEGDFPSSETVMRFLQRRFKVTTRYGGGFVQSIEGLSGGGESGRSVDWFFYVNGVQAPAGASATRLRRNDRVWWDRHDWGSAISIPAVVGAYPEPFRSGVRGRALPTRVECAAGAAGACAEVEKRLRDAGVNPSRAPLGGDGAAEAIRVLVGPWKAIRADATARGLEDGPQTSGVFARPSPGGGIAALDAQGRVRRRLGPGAALLAATGRNEEPPTWVVTGTDAAGTDRAARMLDEKGLDRAFAFAQDGGRGVRLPVGAP